MVAVAGSKGGHIGPLTGNHRHHVERLLAGAISPNQLQAHLQTISRPSIGLVVNNACNLACSHCYLQVRRLGAKALSEDEWLRLATSAVRHGAGLLSVCGKEPLLGQTGINVLQGLRELKTAQCGQFHIGLITNGTLIEPWREQLSQIDPDFIDISVDGLKHQHDAVRGVGAFDKAMPNIDWTQQQFGRRFFIALTIQTETVGILPDALDYFRNRGVQNLFLTLYQPQAYTDPELALNEEAQNGVMRDLEALRKIPTGHPFRVFVDIDSVDSDMLTAFLGSQWFDLARVETDETGIHFLRHHFSNGITLIFRFALYPLAFWHTARVTVDGWYLASEDTLDTESYQLRTIGNAREFDFDFQRMQRHALDSDRYQEIMARYWEYSLPRLRQSYTNRFRWLKRVV